MKAIIILTLTTIIQSAFSQQQQQIQSRNIVVNNFSNVNLLNNRAVLSNIRVNNNEQKPQSRTITRATSANQYKPVKANATNTAKNSTSQVRRRSRPRSVSTTPQVINVPKANELINASNINVPSQNFILENSFDIKSQGFSNVAIEVTNPSVQMESNKAGLDINLDVSLNLKGTSIVRSRTSSSSSSSSSHSKSHMFSKKMAKFKRHFFGKLSSHKKGNHRLDLCFNWKN